MTFVEALKVFGIKESEVCRIQKSVLEQMLASEERAAERCNVTAWRLEHQNKVEAIKAILKEV